MGIKRIIPRNIFQRVLRCLKGVAGRDILHVPLLGFLGGLCIFCKRVLRVVRAQEGILYMLHSWVSRGLRLSVISYKSFKGYPSYPS